MRWRSRASTAAVAGLIIAAALVAIAAESPARAENIRHFFHFNACGSVTDNPDCDAHGRNQELATAIKRSILDWRPVAVSLNEMCKSQFEAVKRKLRRAGYRMHGRFAVTERERNNCEPRTFGIAVLTRPSIDWTGRWRLPSSGSETRRLLCVGVDMGRMVRICSTHITHADGKDGQIRKVKRVVEPWVARGIPVVLMGDFNVEPDDDRLDRIYRARYGGGAHGLFEEVERTDGDDPPCRCGESTHGDRKIDYIFLSGGHWRGVGGDATFSEHSDHDPLRGWGSLRA